MIEIRKNRVCALLLVAFLPLVFSSCSDYSKTDKGLRFKLITRSGKQELPKIGDVIECYFSITNSEDSVIFSNFGKTPDRFPLVAATHGDGDIMDAVSMMSQGDSARFLIKADSFYKKTRMQELPPYVKKGSDLEFTIKLTRILSPQQAEELVAAEKLKHKAEEQQKIEEYIKRKGYNLSNEYRMHTDSATGIRYQVFGTSDTSKRKAPIVDGSKVEFHCIGMLLNDLEYDNSYTLGKTRICTVGNPEIMPPGINTALKKMKEGEKGTFIFPFEQGFGERGVEGMIPPYSTLVYEINILKVQ